MYPIQKITPKINEMISINIILLNIFLFKFYISSSINLISKKKNYDLFK